MLFIGLIVLHLHQQAIRRSVNIYKMTEVQITELGFEFIKTYTHDEFKTNRYARGVLEVEFTYEGNKIRTVDLTISEINCMPISFEQMKLITEVLSSFQ